MCTNFLLSLTLGQDRRRVVCEGDTGEETAHFSFNTPEATESHPEDTQNTTHERELSFGDDDYVFTSSDSDNLAVQLEQELANCEEAELYLEQEKNKREIEQSKQAAQVATSETVRVKIRALRRPKQETIDRYHLYGNTENAPPATTSNLLDIKQESPPTDTDPLPSDLYARGGYWLTPEEISWVNCNTNLERQRTAADISTERNWEALYDRFYTHPEEAGACSATRSRENYRHSAQIRSEESDPSSDLPRSSVSASSPYLEQHCPGVNHRNPGFGRFYQAGLRTPHVQHSARRHRVDSGPQNTTPDNDRYSTRRPTTRQRRPLTEQPAVANARYRGRRVARPLENNWSPQNDLRPRCQQRHREPQVNIIPNIPPHDTRNITPERAFETNLNEVCNLVESLRREFHDLHNPTPRRRNHTYPLTASNR